MMAMLSQAAIPYRLFHNDDNVIWCTRQGCELKACSPFFYAVESDFVIYKQFHSFLKVIKGVWCITSPSSETPTTGVGAKYLNK